MTLRRAPTARPPVTLNNGLSQRQLRRVAAAAAAGGMTSCLTRLLIRSMQFNCFGRIAGGQEASANDATSRERERKRAP